MMAGICNLQWPENSDSRADSSSDACAHTVANRGTPPQHQVRHQAPRAPLDLISGDCSVSCDCASSPNYPENYGANGGCEIGLRSPSTLEVRDFNTEVFWDTLKVNGGAYSGTVGPDRVEAQGQIVWSSDGASQERGWHICAVVPTPAPTPAPTPSPTPAIVVEEGPCFGEWKLCA